MALLKTLNGGPGTLRQETGPGVTQGDSALLPAAAGDPTAEGTSSADRATAANGMYGFFSIEDYPPGIGDLSLTHDDAQGFYDYVSQFVAPNFWYRDANVLSWAYGEQYDDWQSFYGFDACAVEYHSGHGGMSSSGVFSAPMGGTWGGSSWVDSGGMRLGNEVARYIFWSTCESLRVLGGQDPIKTWSAANLGWRMLFGYESTSVDDGNYGRYFWQEWNKNKSFSQAFLDASWRISHSQAPSAVAVGATSAEANDRLYNERLFTRAAASTSWWQWRWYYAASIAARTVRLPDDVRGLLLAPVEPAAALTEAAERFGLTLPDGVRADARGASFADRSGRGLAVGPDGSREVRLAAADADAPQLDTATAVRAAETAVTTFNLSDDVDLVYDRVRYDYTAGGSRDERVAPRVRETVVHFRQVVDGLPVVTPGAGEIQVRVDNTGTVTGVADSSRPVRDRRERPRAPGTTPGDSAPLGAPRATDASSAEDLLDAALQRRLRAVAATGHVPREVTVVPDSTELGYAVAGQEAVVAVRREVEVDMGAGLRKRYVLEVPLAG